MKSPLIYDQRDFKWNLLGDILKIFDSRRVKQEIARQGIKPALKAGVAFRILIISLFFSTDISYVIKELKSKEELRKFAGVVNVPSEWQIYEFLSRFSEEQFMNCVLGILNSLSSPRKRGKACILVDSTDIQLDLNWMRHKISKKSLEDREFKWAYSKSKGYYIGFKLTLAVEYPSMRPLTFLLHSGSPHDSKIFELIMKELQRKRIICKGDIVIFDKGYYKYENYQIGISLYKIVPLIFPHSNANINRILDRITYPLTSYQHGKIAEKTRTFFQKITTEFAHKIRHWREYQSRRSLIEDIFKLKKEGLSLNHVHRYTMRSVHKFISLIVLLAGTLTILGYNTKEQLQTLAES